MARVIYQAAVLEKLHRWGRVASVIDVADVYVAELETIKERLTTDPEAWGDPAKDFRGLRLTLYYHYGPLLMVKYAVHIDGTPVFVMDVKLTPDTPLDNATKGIG